MSVLMECFCSPFHELKLLFKEAYQLSRTRFQNKLHFYTPGVTHYDMPFHQATSPYRFPGISITGRKCWLHCEHCKGRLLESMIPAPTPEKLLKVATMVKTTGGIGCLISGGSLMGGGVPLKKFVSTMKRIRQEMGLKIVVHTGLINQPTAEELADVGIDAAMIDVIGSDETISSVYHLDRSVEDFSSVLTVLEENSIPIVPHIVVGIHYGRLLGERRAVEMLSRHDPAALVIVAFTPLADTPMEHASVPTPVDIARVVLASRLSMPHIPIALGCARPRGAHKARIDALAIRAGVNGLAYPSIQAYNLAKRLKLDIEFHEECCSLLWKEPSLVERGHMPIPLSR